MSPDDYQNCLYPAPAGLGTLIIEAQLPLHRSSQTQAMA